MSILIDKSTKTLVQGMTGRDGSFHTRAMVRDGTNIVGGVTPGKGGETFDGLPVFNNVKEAREAVLCNATVIFVPAAYAAGALDEAIEEEIALIVCITEGIPISEMVRLADKARERDVRIIGPNCPGLISPEKSKLGIIPARIHKPGEVGVVSRSGTLTYEVDHALSQQGMGQSTCVGIGGDPVVGSGFVDILSLFEADPETKGVVMIGEIGGEEEEVAAAYIQQNMTKPVVAFIAGRTAPQGKTMGHAGAIISGGKGTPQAKVKALEAAGVPVAERPDEIPSLMANIWEKRR